MKSIVYFISAANIKVETINRVFDETKFFSKLNGKDLGIKIHFGEDGNQNYLSPSYVKIFIDLAKAAGLNPTLIETSTLYRGARQNRTSHLALAKKHGFKENLVGAPIAILDGERGEKFTEVETRFENVKRAKIAKDIENFDGILNLAHYKGHFVVGFGGVIKNIAMGLAAKGGKLEMHSLTKPSVKQKKCNKCEICLSVCPTDAIVITEAGAMIGKLCIGCASCVDVCPKDAIRIKWNEGSESTQKKIAEYAWAILQNRLSLHFNFALNITPNCDCMNITEKPFMDDIGVFASYDPVACEMSAWDRTKNNINKLYPELNPEFLIDYSEKLGLGKKTYELIKI